jgi:hypothetical protein
VIHTRRGSAFVPVSAEATQDWPWVQGEMSQLIADARDVLDRIGMSVEIVQHLVGANHRPVGQRGVFAYWRTGAGVVAQNELRYLEVK